MTIDEVRHRIGLVKAAATPRHPGALYASDGEAHQLRDALLVDVLKEIAAGRGGAELAAAALAVEDVPFACWFE